MRVFLAVAREQSLSAAGRLLKIDAATVGRRIARLETALETPLFSKSQQGYIADTLPANALGRAWIDKPKRRCGQQPEQLRASSKDAERSDTDRCT